MSETTRLERNGREAKQVSALSAAVVALCTLMAGGGVGTFATGSSVASELKETRAVIVGRLERIEQTLDVAAKTDSAQAEEIKALAERMRAAELRLERLDPSRPPR